MFLNQYSTKSIPWSAPRKKARRSNSFVVLSVIVFTFVHVPALAADAPSLTRVMELPHLDGTAPASPAWSPDNSRLAFLWNDSGQNFHDIWTVSDSGKALRQLTNLSMVDSDSKKRGRDQAGATSFENLRAIAAERANTGINEFIWSADGAGIFFLHNGNIQYVSVDSGGVREITSDGSSKSKLSLSPDGGYLSYLADGDLWLLRIDGNYLNQATHVGQPSIAKVKIGRFNNLDAEYVSYKWSSNSRYIALHFLDRRHVNKMPIPVYFLQEEPFLNEKRRAYPGQDDAIQKLGIYTIADGQVRDIPLPEPVKRNIINYSWSPKDDTLLVEQESDEGEHRWIFVASVAQKVEPRQIYHDYRERRIYSVFVSHWSSDGRRIFFIDDNSGFYRLAGISASGGRPTLLTLGDYDVVGTSGRPEVVVSKACKSIFFTAAWPTPFERHIYEISQSGGSPIKHTSLPGVHEQMVVSSDCRKIAVIATSDLSPSELYVLNVDKEPDQTKITQSPPQDFFRYDWIKPRYVSFPSRLGDYTLHARIIEPPDIDSSKKYPVIVGPVYSNTVRNSWTTRGHPPARKVSGLQQLMALDGDYITIQVDLRGSIGYGVGFREAFQGDWGGGDLQDLYSTVDYLKSVPYVDQARIGIWGNSYGGMLVLFALFENPGMFAAGVAGAPAIDVSRFTSGDQHLSRRPQTHPEIFEKSTLLNYGENLADPLMIIQGLHDDIVPFRTTLMMIEKLMLLGKEFNLVVLPTSPHWWAESEYYGIFGFNKIKAFFDEELGSGALDQVSE